MALMSEHTTKTYQELEMLLGHDAADKLVATYRGQELHIPRPDNLASTHKLAVLLGIDVAKRLCHYWQDSVLTLPMQLAKTLNQRNDSIIKKHKAGMTSNELAKEYQITSRQVRNIITAHNNSQAKKAYARMQYQLFEQ